MLYRKLLLVLHSLLKQVGEIYWTKWLETDIMLWDNNKDVTHHLKSYHKEGLSDLWITLGNGHQIDPQLAPWANELHIYICSYLAKIADYIYKPQPYDTNTLLDNHFQSLTRYSDKLQLNGSECKSCGLQKVTSKDMDTYIAKFTLPFYIDQLIRRACIEEVLNFDLMRSTSESLRLSKELKLALSKSGIAFVTEPPNSRTCHRCSSSNIYATRWNVDRDQDKIILTQVS